MNYLFPLVVFTSNILGSFNDPFEFEGDYGEEVNSVREFVFEQVVSKEALVSNFTDSQIMLLMQKENPSALELGEYRKKLIAKAVQQDFLHGPTLKELVSDEFIEKLILKQQELHSFGFSVDELSSILSFIERCGSYRLFSFFRHFPSEFLNLDKSLRDQAMREGKSFDLPILSSTQELEGHNVEELKANLFESIFTQNSLKQTKPEKIVKNAFKDLDPYFFETYLGPGLGVEDLSVFATPVGQTFFYWLYQSLNLHLVSIDEDKIGQINKVKKIFSNTLGNSHVRAEQIRKKFIEADASVVFTQESDAIVPFLLSENGLFHSVHLQNVQDGTLVFLKGEVWESDYEVIDVSDYEGYGKGRLNAILATRKDGQGKFLLASGHGNSTKSEDGRLQITKVWEKYHELIQLPENQGLQLIIGIDANTKTEEDVDLLARHLESLGLISTRAGPTTVKKRMVTVQHSKAGRFAVDEEDYVIILAPESGGRYQMVDTTIGFKGEEADPAVALPNIENPSDHYPVGVTLQPI